MEEKRKQYLSKIIFRLNVSFYILLAVTAWEFLYWVSHEYSSLSFVLTILAGAVTFFAWTLKKLFEDMKEGF